jgi:hypothetical protein
MERQNDRGASYPAVYFIRMDLKNEKMELCMDLRELEYCSEHYPKEFIDHLKSDVTNRIEEINEILRKVETGVYVAPEDDV